jgi:stearoyl-CoA desaturase (delta-9 desaturase)
VKRRHRLYCKSRNVTNGGVVVRKFEPMSAINLLMHAFGARPYRIRHNYSRNLVVMVWLAWGEEWHNKHHAFPCSAALNMLGIAG